MEAQLAQNLETNRKGERFTLIEPPLPPEEPVSPNRLAVLIIGLHPERRARGGARRDARGDRHVGCAAGAMSTDIRMRRRSR